MTLRSGPHTLDEVARRLSATRQTIPPFLCRTAPIFFVSSASQFCGRSVPVGLTNLCQKWFDNLRSRIRNQEGRRRLASTLKRRNDDLVELFAAQNLANAICLHQAQFGERRIDHVEAVANPLGLSMTNEHDLHNVNDGSGGNVAAVDPLSPLVTGAAPGWYPDPTHRFEFRYFNGERWTADVSRQSIRYFDPIGSAPPVFNAPPSRGAAITALVFSLCSVALAWVPFLFVVGAAGAIVAVILGVIVLRRSARNKREGEPQAIGQGMAIAAICTAVAALALCAVGIHLTRLVVREVDKLVNPGPNEVALDRCETENGHVVAEGSIRNMDTTPHGYTITIAYRLDGETWELDTVSVSDVGPGESADFATASTSVDFSSSKLTCTVESVFGPQPFSD